MPDDVLSFHVTVTNACVMQLAERPSDAVHDAPYGAIIQRPLEWLPIHPFRDHEPTTVDDARIE
jgi:hypothetical protein